MHHKRHRRSKCAFRPIMFPKIRLLGDVTCREEASGGEAGTSESADSSGITEAIQFSK